MTDQPLRLIDPGPPMPPVGERYFEDYVPGAVYTYGPILVTEEEVIDFATRYDPQPMHVDRDWAATGPFGGVIASGWQTVGLMMRLYVDNYLSSVASMVSPGVEKISWRRPVRPGDELRLRVTVLDKKLSRSRPGQGVITAQMEALDAQGETVASFAGVTFMGCREPAPGG